MGKRKRKVEFSICAKAEKPVLDSVVNPAVDPVVAKKVKRAGPFAIQIVAGSYDGVLHGLTTTSSGDDDNVDFANAFLFNAHTSSVRCLALSPPSAPEPGKSQRVLLATGSTDRRVNLYSISAHLPSIEYRDDELSSVAGQKILENPENREIGSLSHHSSTITKLSFPTMSKLISASEDSTVSFVRTRDALILSTMKAPKPKPQNRPSGDTAVLGGSPSGVNDFAVHPSMKVMISVSKGERCMRLWNLITGKKSSVLNFDREALREIGEGRFTSGEGRKIVWGINGEEYCVGFDRDLLVFGMDGKPKCRVMPDLKTKVHKMCYIATDADEGSLLAVSTEEGHISFFSTSSEDLTPGSAVDNKKEGLLSVAKHVAKMGGKEAGITGRIKDFAVLRSGSESEHLLFATGSSDGTIRILRTSLGELNKAKLSKGPTQVGKLLGSHKTSNRITCLDAFVMIPRPEGLDV